jgi:hypothetical protein
MKTLEQFHGFFESDLKPILTELEAQRKRVLHSFGYLVLVIVGIVGIGLLIITANPRVGPGMLLIPLVIAIIVAAIVTPFLSRGYIQRFKTEVLARMARFLDPSLEYRMDGAIDQSTYMSSKLFPHRPDRYKGEDLVEGKIGATAIRFCELHSEARGAPTPSGTPSSRACSFWATSTRTFPARPSCCPIRPKPCSENSASGCNPSRSGATS